MDRKIEQVKHTMEIDESLDLHIKGWKIQRVGWVLIFAFIAVAALGLFGNGFLSKRKVNIGNATIKYERFFRYESEMEVEFFVKGANDSSIISFPQEYISKFKIVRIIPEPKGNFMQAGNVFYVFNGKPDFTVTFYLVPEEPGLVNGLLSVNNTNIQLSHFIYP